VHLPTAQPFDGAAVLAFLAARAIDGVEEVTADGATYRRTLTLPHGDAILALTPRAGGVDAELTLADRRDEPTAIRRARALFGLDQDPAAVRATLGDDPILGPLVAARPGLRVPGAVDGFELAARAVLGQQVSVAAARVLASRITARVSRRSAVGDATLTHVFPAPEALAAAPDDAFPMPRARARTLRTLAAADPRLDAPADAPALLDLWGIGPWTAGYVALRLGDPDVFLPGDVAIVRSLSILDSTVAEAPNWRPMRSQAVLQLWANLANPVAGGADPGGVRRRTG
jgi:AraC family transcriptional regulator, regulatory protein of adaptative response / DNA-3-methyladenine glycosylase II